MIELEVMESGPIELEVVTASADPGYIPVLIDKTITANGVYQASSDSADGYREVTASVPNTYTAADEGKVVDGGALVSQTARTITSNGTYDTTKNNSVTASVPNTYTAADEGKVVDGGALVSQTARTITSNGTYDTTKNNSVTASVPNTYTAADEGKVVDNGALVSQTSLSVTVNGTYDTTKNNEVVVNVSGGDRLYQYSAIVKGTTTGTVTQVTDGIDIASTGTASWNLYAFSSSGLPTYGQLSGHTIHVEYSIEAFNTAAGDEFPLTFDASSNESGTTRLKYFDIASATHSNPSVIGTYDFVVGNSIWTGGTGTVTSSSFLRYRVYCHAHSGASVQFRFKFYAY